MPVTLLPPMPARTWPADLDRLAKLDMQGLLKPRPKCITPITIPAMDPRPPDDGILQRQQARAARVSAERGKKIEALKSQLNRRDARISALEEILKDERADLGGMRKRERESGKTIASLRAEILARDGKIRSLHARVIEVQVETARATKALNSIQLRAHDWLDLREGKRVIREIHKGEA